MQLKILIFASLLMFPATLLAQEVPAQEKPATLYLEVKSAKLRKAPKHWSAVEADLGYGAKLEQLESNAGWVKVRTEAGKEGFVHESAVTVKRVVLKNSAGTDIPVDQSEIVLAGKGFNSDIESRYKQEDPSLNFEAVNKMETFNVDAGQLETFIREGQLKDNESS